MSKALKNLTILSLLLINAVISLILFQIRIEFTSVYFVFSLVSFLLVVLLSFDNVLFTVRYFFLGVIGHLAAAVKVIDPDAKFGHHMVASQSIEIVSVMLYMTNLALLFSYIGFSAGYKIPVKKRVEIRNENAIFLKVSIFLFVFVSILLNASRGPIIIYGSYGSGSDTFSTGLNNLNTIAICLSYFIYILYLKLERIGKFSSIYKKIIIASFVYFYVYVNLLHGVRMDALNGIFGLFVIYKCVRKGDLTVSFKSFVIVAFAFFLIQVVGAVRSNIDALSLDTISFVIRNITSGSSSGILLYQGTLNDLATTFSGIIYLVEKYDFSYLYGSSYLDWVARTPPEFLYPDRPRDLAWIFHDNNFTSGGGFFELSEAFYNFGFLGAAIVPFFISFTLSFGLKLYRNNTYSLLYFITLAGFTSSLLRGALYQNFAYYKSFVTVVILYLIILLISDVLKRVFNG